MIRRFISSLGYFSEPSFIIVGAQKAGTSSLYQNLAQHPQLVPALTKEIHYFDNVKINFGDTSNYHKFFPLPHKLYKNKLTFEATPSYLYHPLAAERIAQYKPNIKIIAIIREPISRAFSAYSMYSNFQQSQSSHKRKRSERRTFKEIVEKEISNWESTNWYNNPWGYIRRGIYFDQVEKYLYHFTRDQILILDYSSYVNHFETTMKRIALFLEIDFRFKFENRKQNSTKYFSEPDPDIIDYLKSFYKPFNDRLFESIEERFDWGY